MKTKHLFFLLLLLFQISSNFAQFKIDAQYRNRFELRDGYQKLAEEGSTPAFLISQRTRLSFAYATEKLKLKITPQDVRIWGDEKLSSSSGVFGDSASLDLFEAFAEIRLKKIGWLSVGRQQLIYDNKRLLGDRNWNQSGIAYDAVLLKLLFSDFNIHFGASWNTMIESLSDNLYPTSRIKSLNFIWMNKKFGDILSVSLMHIASGVTESDTKNKLNFRQTAGTYIEITKDNFKFWLDGYYQFGKNQKGTDVGAYLFDAEGSLKTGLLTSAIGIGYLSGNKKTGTEMKKDNLFDVLYGNRHRYFGFMDYYRNFASNTKQGGLMDVYLNLDFKITKAFSIQNTFHYFQLAQTNDLTPNKKKLGYENDFLIKYKFSEWGSVEGGYMFYIPEKTLKTIQNVADEKFSQFVYMQLTITPNLFEQKQQEPKE